MKFNIYNLTDVPIQVSEPREELVLLHPKRSTVVSRFHGRHLHLSALRTGAGEPGVDVEEPTVFRISLPGFWARRGATWKDLWVAEDCPWRVYWFWPAKALVVLPRRNMASFLADMPDTLSLASLALPGTHDTMAFYGWPISQCQSGSTPLSTQLLQGIRVIDIRLGLVPILHSAKTGPAPASPGGGQALPTPQFKLVAYHGIFPERTPFSTILSSVHTFLTSPAGSRETVVMSIKQEDFTAHAPTLFSQLVKEEIMNSPGGFRDTDANGNRDLGIWYLQNRIPTLGEVRGKVVLLSRFGVNGEGWEGGWEGLGIHPLTWPDSQKTGFVWDLKGVPIRTHDWYAIPSFLSIPEKATLATLALQPSVPFPLELPVKGKPAPADGGKDAPGEVSGENELMLNIAYLSAATFPLALPPTVANGLGWPGFSLGFEGVNARVGRWFLEELVPELKTPSPIKSASAPSAVENGLRAVKQESKSALAAGDGTSATPATTKETGSKGFRWFRPKVVTGNTSKSDLLERVDVDAEVQSPLGNASRLRGWALMDFYSSEKALVPLIAEFNYRARKSGEEGWP